MQAWLPCLGISDVTVHPVVAGLVVAVVLVGWFALQTHLIYRDGRADLAGLRRNRKVIQFTGPLVFAFAVWKLDAGPIGRAMGIGFLAYLLVGMWLSHWIAERRMVKQARVSVGDGGGPR